MNLMTDVQVYAAALEFMSRASLSGKEALTFVQTAERLSGMMNALIEKERCSVSSQRKPSRRSS